MWNIFNEIEFLFGIIFMQMTLPVEVEVYRSMLPALEIHGVFQTKRQR